MKKKISLIILALAIIIISILALSGNEKTELKTIKSERELYNIYEHKESNLKEAFISVVTLPFSLITYDSIWYGDYYYRYNTKVYDGDIVANSDTETTGTSKDYSKTNIQVENVDEADIIKTDGNYIYSISDNNVVITNTNDGKYVKIEAIIKSNDNTTPEDLFIYKNKLVVISAKFTDSETRYYSNYYGSNTAIKIYDLTDKANPSLLKSYELYAPYYTSRCIDNRLLVISSGYLRVEDDKVIRTYKENNQEKEIPLKSIKYLKDAKTSDQTLISSLDLDNLEADVNVNSYLIDVSNSYVSENNIYLLDRDYSEEKVPISKIFGLKGVFGLSDFEDDYSIKTKIYKFSINKNGTVSYKTKGLVDGTTIDQYSVDEKDNHLRIASYGSDGAKITILDEKLKEIGSTKYVAKGQRMYSSRFMGEKAYLVTYKNTDPLYVIDLKDEKNPQVLGELHIPGYSTYLHPYDETHLIGIGMETKEEVYKDINGRVTSSVTVITGMKMALFDVSDVNNPIQISQTLIGDRRTTSAILTNPKALLFSKEKNLIAIPVNNYSEDFEIISYDETYSSTVNAYKNYNKNYIGEGYFVYNINIEDGFRLKGIINHEENKTYDRYSHRKMLRGVYIDDNLYTISQNMIKVNDLNTLKPIDEIVIR